MAKKMIRPIRTETEYDETLEEIERYFEDEPKPGTPEADRFDLLALIVEDYERKRWPIEPPETIDAIRFRMETGDYTQADLGRLLGSRRRASDILTRKRPHHDENGLETAPRVEHSGRGADRTAADARKKVSGVKSTVFGGNCVYRKWRATVDEAGQYCFAVAL
jgi:HTH-type transcriptional regulator/antitoxin HigA